MKKFLPYIFLFSLFSALPAPSYAVSPNDSVYYHLLSTGQSLSTGAQGVPVLTTTQPYLNKMLNSTNTLLTPLVETSTESMNSTFANTLTETTNQSFVVTKHGVGGYSYSQLKKGTAPYQKGMLQVTNAKKEIEKLGKQYTVSAVTVIHGEADRSNGPLYQGYLEEWYRDYNTDVKAITGQSNDLVMFTDQMSTFLSSYTNLSVMVPMAQLAASESNPGKIILVGPKYFFDYADGSHMTNKSYRKLGYYYARAYKKVMVDKVGWTPLSPKQISLSGNIITLKLNVPTPPIQIDTTQVLLNKNYGFEYFDTSSPPAITSVTITSPDTISLTLASTPTGSNKRLRYAFRGEGGGAHSSTSARGNIRDSDPAVSPFGDPLQNWLVHFDKPIGTGPIATNSPSPSASGSCTPLGNIDCIGTVTSKDLAYVLYKLGTNDAKADLNGSGRVDSADIRILLTNFGK